MKLGEALVESGLITKQQLNLALERQVIFGGRLGTNLLELRILNEEELAKFVGAFYKRPFVTNEVIDSIPKDVLNAIPREVIEKYKILPLRREGKKLHVAMLNAKELEEIDELGFITGSQIIPYVIPEMRLLYALEKYYGIKSDPRYVTFMDRFKPEFEIFDSLEKVKEALIAANDEEEMAQIIIRLAGSISQRAAIFMIHTNKIRLWKAKGFSTDRFEAKGEIPIFSEVIKNKKYYRGPVLDTKNNVPLIYFLSGIPQDVLVHPIVIKGRVAGLFYFDNGNDAVLDKEVYYMSFVASLFSLTLEFLSLKKKILEFSFQM